MSSAPECRVQNLKFKAKPEILIQTFNFKASEMHGRLRESMEAGGCKGGLIEATLHL